MRLVVLLLIAGVSPALADAKSELRSACTSDAMKVCSWADLRLAAIGNYTGVTVCFRRHRSEISEECAATLKRHGH